MWIECQQRLIHAPEGSARVLGYPILINLDSVATVEPDCDSPMNTRVRLHSGTEILIYDPYESVKKSLEGK